MLLHALGNNLCVYFMKTQTTSKRIKQILAKTLGVMYKIKKTINKEKE